MGRRLRSYWLIRQRYRHAANLAALLGGASGLFLVMAPTAQGTFASPDAWSVVVVVLMAALLPRLFVLWLWRTQRWRLRERLG